MGEQARTLVVAPKLGMDAKLPTDWQNQLSGMPGVELLGSSFGRVQVRASADAREAIDAKFGHILNIEEAAPRSTKE